MYFAKSMSLILPFFLMINNAFAQNYICTAEKAAIHFFSENSNDWHYQIVDGFSLIVREDGAEKKYNVYIHPGGQYIASCEYWFKEAGFAECTSSGNFKRTKFMIGSKPKKATRFMLSSLNTSFLLQHKSQNFVDSGSILMAGECSKF